jgi:hypothetical protein
MAAAEIKIVPPRLLAAGSAAAETAAKAAALHPGTAATGTPGSPFDTAWATLAAAMKARGGQMDAETAARGPQVAATTQAGVAELEGQDAQNAEQIDAVGKSQTSVLI